MEAEVSGFDVGKAADGFLAGFGKNLVVVLACLQQNRNAAVVEQPVGEGILRPNPELDAQFACKPARQLCDTRRGFPEVLDHGWSGQGLAYRMGGDGTQHHDESEHGQGFAYGGRFGAKPKNWRIRRLDDACGEPDIGHNQPGQLVEIGFFALHFRHHLIEDYGTRWYFYFRQCFGQGAINPGDSRCFFLCVHAYILQKKCRTPAPTFRVIWQLRRFTSKP